MKKKSRTIRIDRDVWRFVSKVKKKNESWSDAVKRAVDIIALKKRGIKSMRKMVFVFTVAMLSAACAIAAEIPNDLAVRACLGEARGDGYNGMYAIACAIRNRGHLRGVYGKDAVMPDLTPELWQKASKAWFESEDGPDPTRGSDHWFSEDDLKKLNKTRPRWFGRLTRVVKIGGNTFYRDDNARQEKN